MKIDYEGFDWDYGNFLHAQHHDTPVEAIEKIFKQTLLYFLDIKNTSREKRWEERVYEEIRKKLIEE